MPDRINVLKICAILTAGAISLAAASRSAESYAAQTALKEKTLAEAILQNQLKQELEKAEKKLENELREQSVTIVTTVMETKPPVTLPPETVPPESEPPDTEPAETEAPDTEPAETVLPEETAEETAVYEPAGEEVITEFTRGGLLPENREDIEPRTVLGLSEEETEQVLGYLIEHYFLDGYAYSEAETDPERKKNKYYAAQMEESVVKSFYLIVNSVSLSDIESIANTDVSAVRAQIEAIRGEFIGNYADAYQNGTEVYTALYEECLEYFDRMLSATEKIEEALENYKNAANPLIALGLITSSLNDVIIPEVMAVLEQAFDIVELTQDVFLEGTRGVKLLSRDEVRDIVINPGLALYMVNTEE